MGAPPQPRPRKRRWRRFFIGGVLACLVALVLYPVWLPWVLRPVTTQFGVQFETCQRLGYRAFTFSNIRWRGADVSVQAGQLTVQAPHRWLWSRVTGTVPSEAQVKVQDWEVSTSGTSSAAAPEEASTARLLDGVKQEQSLIQSWIRWVTLTNGLLKLPERDAIPIPSVGLRNGRVTVVTDQATGVLDLSALDDSHVTISVDTPSARAILHLDHHDPDWVFDGEIAWQSNRFALEARFDRTGWWPADAAVSAETLSVPLEALGLNLTNQLHGTFSAFWTNESFRYDLALADHSRSPRTPAQRRVSAQITGGGDLTGCRIEQLKLQSPIVRAELARPVEFDYSGRVQGEPSAFSLWADLDAFESVPVSGQLTGLLTLEPVLTLQPQCRFHLSGTNIAAMGVHADTVDVRGRVDGPTVALEELNVAFPIGVTGWVSGEIDVAARQVSHLDWRLHGEPSRRDGRLAAERLDAEGAVSGHWSNLVHTTRMELSGVTAGLFAAESASIRVSGTGTGIDPVEVRAARGDSRVTLIGAGRITSTDAGPDARLDIRQFDMHAPPGALALREPARLELLKTPRSLTIDSSPLEWDGPDCQVTLRSSMQWPQRATGELLIQGFRSAQISDFIRQDLPDITLQEAQVSFHWDEGPLQFDALLATTARSSGDLGWTLRGRARSEGGPIEIEHGQLDVNGTPALTMSGVIPVNVFPSRNWAVTGLPTNAPMRLDLVASDSSPLWPLLGDRAGVELELPALTVETRGSGDAIHGVLSFGAKRISLAQTNLDSAVHIPALDNPWLELAFDLNGLQVREARALMEGQPIVVEGEWPIEARDWSEWISALQNPATGSWHGRVRLEQAELSALSVCAPEIIGPSGTMDLDLAIRPGPDVEGRMVLHRAGTRPIEPVGALRQIEANLSLDGREITLHQFEALLGGRPIQLSGQLGWRPDGDHRLDLRLKGEDLSLVHDPEIFVRADLDVHLRKDFSQPANLSGDVGLRRSLLFRDFNALVGPDRSRPEQRPPYFSIAQPPFGDWQLNLQLKGERFLQVISPAFKGVLSAGMQLQGTLREPLAIGAVSVDEGKLLFPFGTLTLESGRVELSREDPYRPSLDFKAMGQNFGYTLTADLSGPADAPNLALQSVPPLTTQQILLMLSAGEVPRSDFGYTTADKASRVGVYVGREFVNRIVGSSTAGERLVFRSGEYITDEGTPTYSLEYRLTDRWSAFGEYNRFRDFNSGLKFKVLSR